MKVLNWSVSRFLPGYEFQVSTLSKAALIFPCYAVLCCVLRISCYHWICDVIRWGLVFSSVYTLRLYDIEYKTVFLLTPFHQSTSSLLQRQVLISICVSVASALRKDFRWNAGLEPHFRGIKLFSALHLSSTRKHKCKYKHQKQRH